jgi:DNA-binding NtrC family response regulator
MAPILDDVERWAPHDDCVLLLGASGVGKSLIAQHIHDRSGRRGEFTSESASGLQGTLLKAELFGYAKGAFTGATETREGLIETANRGTFFLDEIGDADAELQGLMLRFQDRREVRRIGERRFRPVDVRLIAATNADLPARILEGRFREDLLARFGKLVLRIPSLSERREEIVPFARHFMEYQTLDLKPPKPFVLSPQVERVLRAAPWPGNVRELQATCRYMALGAGRDDRVIELRHLPKDVLATAPQWMLQEDQSELAAACLAALARAGGNKKAAAREVGISRTTFYKRVKYAQE